MPDGNFSPETERRANHVLREVLDDLIDLVRNISTRGEKLSDEDVHYAQRRLEWLADEVWRLSLNADEQKL